MRRLGVVVALLAMLGAVLLTTGTASAAKGGKGKDKPLVVCKFGCKYKSIQKAVDKSRKNDTIQVKPGKYSEGVLVEGHKHDGLTIEGTKKNAKRVVLDGKKAKTPTGPAQNGIAFEDVNDVTVKNLTAKNYLANGIFLYDSVADPDVAGYNGKIDCNDYLIKNVVVSFNRSYGVYAFGCAGGRITKSTGFGHGDSAFYIGATPVQAKPKTTRLDHLEAYENVLGYSGTNSRYVSITEGDWYNNGIGIVPNTLDSEPFEPTADSAIRNNDIFWNNFNYFLPNSRVDTVSNGLGEVNGATLQYPTGVGVALFGASGWVVEDNNIFGNFKYGAAAFSDPFNEDDDATSMNNQFLNNAMGKNGTDTNAVDFWIDGSGSGNCFSGNVSSTFDPSPSATNEELYPACPAPAGTNPGATGSSLGNLDQVGELIEYVTTDPPENQECSWTRHEHPAHEGFDPLTVTPGPTCP